ncbi:hypothetical protein [Candidatus Leptofilum sp.]|uniref:hypothetical protein n=1 Tax=Candidatus Leptofilum sp. TaxID=3241576 RepID=UPI003B5C1227
MLSFETQPTQGVRGFDLKEKIGEGAYGTIHRAIQPAVGREVAVKVIRRKGCNEKLCNGSKKQKMGG